MTTTSSFISNVVPHTVATAKSLRISVLLMPGSLEVAIIRSPPELRVHHENAFHCFHHIMATARKRYCTKVSSVLWHMVLSRLGA
jgi:hypothetical protein